ncbi:MAG: TonB-dependent receptor [Prevotella sp.]|jgi:TonB-linked SusC/RagA family outer membrane protein|nr:TonB-dependent receptor [Prevotella sp.]
MVRKMMVLLCLSFICMLTATAQTEKASGTVVSESGEPIVGAAVMIEGTQIGTITDVDGHFSFTEIPVKASKIKVSYLGMQSKTVPLSRKMTITLTEDNKTLDDVLVVAYGTAKKSSYAGSASMVTSKQLTDLPSSSFENALTGKVAGLQITNASGQVGSVPTIQIRGIGSMNAGSTPLYVVDGVPMNAGNVGQMSGETYSTNNIMSTLNPEDIESVSVLKDAAAASLYGSRAANGVILITTKQGKKGKAHVEFKSSIGFTPSWATKNYEPASTQHQVDMLYTVFHDYQTSNGADDATANAYALKQLNRKFNRHGYSFSTSGTGAYEDVIISDYDNSGRAGSYYNWDDAYFRTAVYQSNDIAVSGGGDNTSYYSSLSYTKDDGRLRKNSFKRYSGRVNLTQKVGKFLDFNTNVSLARITKTGYNDTRTTGSNYFMQTRNLLWGLYWPTNYATGEDWTTRYGSYAYNGLYYDNEWENKSTDTRVSAVETVTLHLLDGLDLRTIFSYDNTNVRDHLYYSANHFLGSSDEGSIDEMRTNYEKWVSSTTASYNKMFGDHTIGLLFGFEAEKNTTDYTRASGTHLPNSTLHTVSTAGTLSSAGYQWGNTLASIISKVDYNYADRYFLSASYRRDGSSKLAPEERWGNFWSVSGAWRIKQEAFMAPVKWLSDLKLRASYGVNGTLPSSNYAYMNLMSYSSKYMGNPAGIISQMSNVNLSWETNYTFNVGLDFGFFNQRLRGTVEYFTRNSKNLLQDVPISGTTGFSSVLQNIGKINNHGVELTLEGDILRKKDFVWTAGVNATFLSSKVKKLYNGADIIWYDPTGDDNRAQFIYREGESTLAFYGYEWAGVDPTNGKSVYYVNDPDDGQKGDFTFNGRGATYDYNKANYTIIGNGIPDVTGGINTTATWKGIELGLNFTYKLGGSLYDGAYKDVADDGYYWERIRAESYYENMWTPTHTDGTEPALSGNDLTDAIQYSSRHISSATYLRLKTLTLAYTLPRQLVNKVWMSNVRVYFNAENLLTFSKYKEADPEVNSYSTRGWETPIGKSFIFGINITF